MSTDSNDLTFSSSWPEFVRRVRSQTPARLLEGRSGAAYRTTTQLELREAHAAAKDAVRAELDIERDFGASFISRWNLPEAHTEAQTKDQYLLRPDLGRHFNESSRVKLRSLPRESDLQIAIGDGLSVTAVSKQAPPLLEKVHHLAHERGWTIGQPFIIHYCRVGILNEIGTITSARVVVLLIGERPGLATAESLSAYLAYRPNTSHTDADRNLISNIHSRGVTTMNAATRIVNLSARMMRESVSGYKLREEFGAIIMPPSLNNR